jgi:hypothetical protein
MKFTLDVTLPERILANRGDVVDDAFSREVLAEEGVASVFGVNDFVTVTRVPGADWAPIVCAVEEAAARHLPAATAGPSAEAVERARALLRAAVTRPVSTPVALRGRGSGSEPRLRPVERRVRTLLDRGVETDEIARRFHHSAQWVERVRTWSRLPSRGRPSRHAPGLRPLERRVLEWRRRGVAYDEIASRFRRGPRFIEQVEHLARYKLAR